MELIEIRTLSGISLEIYEGELNRFSPNYYAIADNIELFYRLIENVEVVGMMVMAVGETILREKQS